MNAGTVRLNKRLCNGISVGANYQYGHAIDDATSVNGSTARWSRTGRIPSAQEGHSVLDIRHQVSGTYLFELPFGPDKFWATTGVGLAYPRGLLDLRQFQLRHRAWLSPGFEPTSQSVECGNTSGLRPNLTGNRSLPAAARCAMVQHCGLSRRPTTTRALRLLRQRSARFD